MKNTIYIILALLLLQFVSAQNINRTYQSHKEEGGTFQVVVNDGRYVFQFYSESIIETTFIPEGETPNKTSHAVVLKPETVETNYSYVGNEITYGTSALAVTITTEPFKISYTYKDNPVISEKAGYVKNDSLETIQFNLTKDEVLYGGGARALGMNRRGNRLQLYNRAHYGYETRSELMNFTLPIVMSSNSIYGSF